MRQGCWIIRPAAWATMAMLSATLTVAQIEDGTEPPADEVEPTTDTIEPAVGTVEPADVPVEPVEDVPAPPEVVAEPADVMRPTRNGLRLTPRLAELGARLWVREEVGKWVDLSGRQEAELARRVARRAMETARDHGERGQEFLEFLLEAQFASQGRMRSLSPEMKQEFGERVSELMPVARDFLKDVARDTRPLLSDEQWAQAREGLRTGFKDIDRLEKKMKRWAEGGAREDEDIDDFEDEEGREPGSRAGEGSDAKPVRRSQALARARRWAQAELRRLERGDWQEFLKNAGRFFKFNDEQMTEARELAAKHRKRAEEIITPAWRERLRENRIKYQLRWKLGAGGEPTAPWIYHLEREYNREVAPLEEIRVEFKDAVIALATAKQRNAAAALLLERVTEHGMDFDETDVRMLQMARD